MKDDPTTDTDDIAISPSKEPMQVYGETMLPVPTKTTKPSHWKTWASQQHSYGSTRYTSNTYSGSHHLFNTLNPNR